MKHKEENAQWTECLASMEQRHQGHPVHFAVIPSKFDRNVDFDVLSEFELIFRLVLCRISLRRLLFVRKHVSWGIALDFKFNVCHIYSEFVGKFNKKGNMKEIGSKDFEYFLVLILNILLLYYYCY
jgi:hypothetical protein